MLRDHYSLSFPHFKEECRRSDGRAREFTRDVCVLRYRLDSGQQVFATCGMGSTADQQGLELHWVTEHNLSDPDTIVLLLYAVALEHATNSRLGLEHTVDFGQPWQPGSSCTRGLVSLPYRFGPALEWPTALKVRCLWLIPVTEAEVEFKKLHGTEALEARFDSDPHFYCNPSRRSFA